MDPVTRKELYLAKLSGLEIDIPDPITREEIFLAKLCGVDIETPNPVTRYEMFLDEFKGGEFSNTPITRLERFIAKAAGIDIPTEQPITREEYYWSNIEGGDPLTTFTGAIVRFLAKKAKPIKNITANFAPVQSLNGYDNPWPPGGGKNKFNYSTYTAGRTGYGLESSVVGEYFRFTGTCTSGDRHVWTFANVPSADQALAATASYKAFVISGNAPEIETISYYSASARLQITATLVLDQVYDFTIGIVGYTDGVEPTAYSPYSNICPISGHSGCEVVRTGKNLLDPSTVGQGAISGVTGLPYADNRRVYTDFIKIDGSAFAVSNSANMQAVPMYYDKDKNIITNGSWTNCPASFSPSSSAMYVRLVFRLSTDAQIAPSDLTNAQCELGSTASDYEAYSGTTVAISFGTTVYGGPLTVNEDGSGQIVAEYAIKEAQTLAWTARTGRMEADIADRKYGAGIAVSSSHYKGEWVVSWANMLNGVIGSTTSYRVICVKDDEHQASLADWQTFLTAQKTANTPVQICYELAEPVTIPLTASQIQTLVGVNTVWVNSATGNITVQAYGTPII